MTKPRRDGEETTEEKVENFKNLLASFWAKDLQRAFKCGFDAGRKSIRIVGVETLKKKAKDQS